jgi:hypothetical protein
MQSLKILNTAVSFRFFVPIVQLSNVKLQYFKCFTVFRKIFNWLGLV